MNQEDPDKSLSLIVYRPEANSSFNQTRPNTVGISTNTSHRSFADRLHEVQLVQKFLNMKIAVTFKSVNNKEAFLALDFVKYLKFSFSCPVWVCWVCVNFKPTELKVEVANDRIRKYGNVLSMNTNS